MSSVDPFSVVLPFSEGDRVKLHDGRVGTIVSIGVDLDFEGDKWNGWTVKMMIDGIEESLDFKTVIFLMKDDDIYVPTGLFKPKDRVVHKFGNQGTVIRCNDIGKGKAELLVKFDDVIQSMGTDEATVQFTKAWNRV